MGFNLDIGKMKFLKSDEHSTTLQHPKGHTVTIAHNVLSPKNREALQALSKVATDARTPEQASEYGKVIHKMAKGGKPALAAHKSPGGGAQLGFDSGGKVPVPSQPNQGQQDKQEYAKKIASSSQQGTAIPDTSTLVERLKNAWAEGGKIEQMRSQHGGEGNETCYACGGPVKRKMYADPDQPVDQNDSAPSPTAPSDIGGVQQTIPYQPPKTKEEQIKAKTDEALENYKNALSTAHNFLMRQPNLEKFYPPTDTETPPTNIQPQQQPPPSNDEAQIGKEVEAADRYGQITYDANGNPIAPAGMSQEEIYNAPALEDGGPKIKGGTSPAQISHADQPLSPSGQFVSGNQTGIPQPQIQTPAQQVQPTLADAKTTVTNDLNNHIQAFQNDLDAGHIKPKTYSDLFHDRSTLGKISGIFGMLLSGMGSGLAHQPNMAFEMMNNQIKNDLDAQQNSVANRQNFLRINQEGLMRQAQANQLDTETAIKARALTNIQMNQAALHSLNVLANGQGTGQEMSEAQKAFPNVNRQQAQQMLGMVAPMFNAENARIADLAASKIAYMHQVLGEGTNGNTAGNPAMEIRKKQLMGFITPQQGEEGLKEIKNVENMNNANDVAMKAFDQIAERASLKGYATHGYQNQKQIDALWDPMIDKLTKTNEGRVTPITVGLMGKWKPLFTDSPATTALKRKQMHDTIYQGLATPTLDSIGVSIHKGEPPGQPQGQRQYKEGDKLQNPRTGAMITLKNGRWVPIGQ